eukprot:1157708-Pelagomonas_calceolata.AAC.2
MKRNSWGRKKERLALTPHCPHHLRRAESQLQHTDAAMDLSWMKTGTLSYTFAHHTPLHKTGTIDRPQLRPAAQQGSKSSKFKAASSRNSPLVIQSSRHAHSSGLRRSKAKGGWLDA